MHKRGPEELHSSTFCMNNQTDYSYQDMLPASTNDAKKAKLDSTKAIQAPPSKVVHIRNMPTESTEAEVVALGVPFGRVTNVLMLKPKNQAFLEMETEGSAATMVSFYTNVTPQIRQRPVYIQYSNHRQLKTDNASPQQNVAAQAALAAQPMMQQQARSGLTTGEALGGQNCVLRVIVENMLHSVTIDILYQIFNKFGTVLKIVTFTKNNYADQFQALIQYDNSISAQTAKLTLDNQNIYTACCTLRIEYSKLTNLNIKYNNDKSRDYTRPDLPSGEGLPPTIDTAAFNFGAVPSMLQPNPFAAFTPQLGGFVPGSLNSLAGAFPLVAAQAAAQAVANPGVRLSAGCLQPMTSSPGCVLLVSNLNTEKVTPEALFTLFGVYGDVVRVKILYAKQDNALVQMAEPGQTHTALTHLNNLKVYGQQIRVTPSKHNLVQMPKEGQEDSGLTKDFTDSPLHRFKKPGSKNFQNIYPPCSTLHLSNIPPSASEEQLKDIFEEAGGVVKAFKFFQSDRKMALLQMGSAEEATIALVECHNYKLGESHHLRVSFAKNNIV